MRYDSPAFFFSPPAVALFFIKSAFRNLFSGKKPIETAKHLESVIFLSYITGWRISINNHSGIFCRTARKGALSMAEYIVSSWQVSAGITLNAGDTMIVSDGGTAETTTINEGWMDVMEGAVAAGVTVNLGGWMNVSAGATATNVVENGGGIQIGSDAKVIFTPNAFSGLVLADENEATVHSGTTAVSPTVNPHGYLYVSSGGSATNVVENGGFVTVDDDAYATFTPNAFAGLVLSGWANATVHSGTTATDTAVYDGVLEVYKGGLANNTTVNPQGDMYVYSGGTATVVENGGYVDVEEGANVTFTPNAFAGLVLSDWADATVHSGTTAVSPTVNPHGYLFVSSGGSATNVVENGGYVEVEEGANVTFT
ncbi:MAG: hypothetical protein J6A21_04825, partial [Lentisphaeria bacterium]|nr:hypothetical protein [Lentisphaeria bacterium]